MVFRIIAAVVILLVSLGAWKCSATSSVELNLDEMIESSPTSAGHRDPDRAVDPNKAHLEELDIVRPHYIKR